MSILCRCTLRKLCKTMYSATKKTRLINSFKRTAVNNVRDLYAKYGMRINTRALHGTDQNTISDAIPQGSAVIGQMISGQEILRGATKKQEDLPE